jgi:hypothetical protein
VKAELVVAALVVALIFGAFSPVLFIVVVVFGGLYALLSWIGDRW